MNINNKLQCKKRNPFDTQFDFLNVNKSMSEYVLSIPSADLDYSQLFDFDTEYYIQMEIDDFFMLGARYFQNHEGMNEAKKHWNELIIELRNNIIEMEKKNKEVEMITTHISPYLTIISPNCFIWPIVHNGMIEDPDLELYWWMEMALKIYPFRYFKSRELKDDVVNILDLVTILKENIKKNLEITKNYSYRIENKWPILKVYIEFEIEPNETIADFIQYVKIEIERLYDEGLTWIKTIDAKDL